MSDRREVLPEQLSAAAAAQEYAAFLAKFEAKKTTDDCFTPPEVFAAVHRWAEAEYGLQGRRIVRPFHPGGDFVAFDYQPGDVVLDNPPFSILTKIRRFYDAQGIDYFLFAPALSLFSTRAQTMLVVGEVVEYANGAQVATSFVGLNELLGRNHNGAGNENSACRSDEPRQWMERHLVQDRGAALCEARPRLA